MDGILPKKSRKIYEAQYDTFVKWCCQRKLENVNEDVLLVFFAEKSKTLSSSTLWAHYSMLKTMLNVKRNIDVSKFYKLSAFLKRKSEGYKPKKAKVLTLDQIDKFLLEAPDKDFLMIKTSASLLADSGASIDVLKRHGGWKSASVAEGYIENSINTKKIVADSIFGLGVGNSTESASAHQVCGSAVSASSASSTSSKNNIVQNTIDEPIAC
ncbi:hypothetical protein NQ315_004021 [Exocentrus adspersus]|uniref:Tyr recombinase domain-containing protein n=1 Tax=Exocentrus adspersus TaxID=1586481 RepID=A0AAV8W6I5_9CUCU|nr:hypothetical protein NQ315_004021 [Exocentrus adspersus]